MNQDIKLQKIILIKYWKNNKMEKISTNGSKKYLSIIILNKYNKKGEWYEK